MPTKTVQIKANIVPGTKTISSRANIIVNSTLTNSAVEQWDIHETLGAFSRQFNIVAQNPDAFQVGRDIAIAAGYDGSNVTLMQGNIDQVAQERTPNNATYHITGRDKGAKELHSLRVTRSWHSDPATFDIPTAHEVIQEAAALVNLNVGSIQFPDYFLYNSYVAIGKRILDIVAELAEPFNQFARIQYYSQIENHTLSVIRVDWQHPGSSVYRLFWQHHDQQSIQQTLYLDEPRLNEVQTIVIRGAAYTVPKTSLGVVTKVEYKRNFFSKEVEDATVPGGSSNSVLTEIETITTSFGDKILTVDEFTYINEALSSETHEQNYYVEPGDLALTGSVPLDLSTLNSQSANPSENALLLLVARQESGLDSLNTTPQTFIFHQKILETTQHFYDEEENVSGEITTTQEYNTETGKWEITSHSTLTHSQTTGGSVRTHLRNFTFEDNAFILSNVAARTIGGTRPSPNHPSSRRNVKTVQAQEPQGDIDIDGNVIDPGEGLFVWNFESPYLNQSGCAVIYANALEEKTFQLGGFNWEIISVHSVLNPNLRAGQSVAIEVFPNLFQNYIIEEVAHNFTPQTAYTSLTAKRLTTDPLPGTAELSPLNINLEVDFGIHLEFTKSFTAKANIIVAAGPFAAQFTASNSESLINTDV